MLGITSLLTMIQNFLGVPLGSQLRKAGNNTTQQWDISRIKNIELIASILSITVDDVCIGSSPFYYRHDDDIAPGSIAKYNKILKQLNSISKWVAYDLLADGYSVYKVKVKKDQIMIYPILFPLRFVLNEEKKVVAYRADEEGDLKGMKPLRDVIIFINYDKSSLSPLNYLDDNKTEVDENSFEFEVAPKPIQLSNISDAAQELILTEKSILRYRKDVSRIVRFISVEVGLSKGDTDSDVLDSISSGINANSISLEGTASDIFDDEIPIFPTRRGLGKPELEVHVPDINIQNMADLDHVLSKIFLAMKFPKTYADFSQSLDATAVSMIRGDIRYSRMLKTCRSLIENTVNEWFSDVSDFRRYHIKFKLSEIPNPEDEEVITAMQGYQDFLSESFDFIVKQSENKEEAYVKLDIFADLLGNSANLPSIENWMKTMRQFIEKMAGDESEDIESEDIEFSGSIDDIPPRF
nr:MAG TPA: capsid assembly protease [Caudoviricetes sp.]